MQLDCTANGTLQVHENGTTTDPPYRWRAASHPGHHWFTRAAMVDMMFETAFDGDDVLGGVFEVKVELPRPRLACRRAA